MSLVSLTRIRNNTTDSMKESIREALGLINYSFRKEIRTVVIKPNLCYYWDHTTGQTTDPKFTAAIIEMIREEIATNVQISIVESDASAMKCRHAFRMLGYEKLSQAYAVPLINLSQDASESVKVTVGGHSLQLRVPMTIKNADLRINVPKIKYTFEEIKITCALKNVFGCNPFPAKFRYHPRLGETIVALNKLMRFNLCIVDGNVVSGAEPRRLGLVMASEDPVALDAAAAQIAGLNASKVGYIQLAKKEGLGDTSFIINGEPLSRFKSHYPRRDLRRKMMGQAYSLVTLIGLAKKLGI